MFDLTIVMSKACLLFADFVVNITMLRFTANLIYTLFPVFIVL